MKMSKAITLCVIFVSTLILIGCGKKGSGERCTSHDSCGSPFLWCVPTTLGLSTCRTGLCLRRDDGSATIGGLAESLQPPSSECCVADSRFTFADGSVANQGAVLPYRGSTCPENFSPQSTDSDS